jgi:hypothetical protein
MTAPDFEAGRILKCPFCGLRVVAIDSRCEFVHERPTCDAFREAVESFGLKPAPLRPAVVLLVDKDDN